MNYKESYLFQRLSSIEDGIKNNILSWPECKNNRIKQYQKILIGKNLNGKPIPYEMDFVIFSNNNFDWEKQNSKEDILLAVKFILKNSIFALNEDIENYLFKLHSIKALRKILIIVDTIDEETKISIPKYFYENYYYLLTFPTTLKESYFFERCPFCGSYSSIIEFWTYNEKNQELVEFTI
jgi:hypothetical protein